MNVISTDQLYKKVQLSKFKTAVIYDRFFTTVPQNIPYSERFEMASPEELEAALKDFVNDYSGMYSIILRKSGSGNASGACLCRVNLVPEVEQTIQGTQINTGANPVQMKETILAEIKAEMQLELLKSENNLYKNRLAELDTTSGRMGLMIENFMMAKMGKAAPMFQNGAQLQGTVEIENKEEEEIEDNDFAQALIKIKDKFGAANLLKIADKIDAQDPTIEMIINNLNNG